jgi:probable F420-dependent oxidoreductase
MLPRAAWAEAHGYDSLWIPDGQGRMDAFTAAAGMATLTESIRICTAIVPVYTRPAPVIATSAMTMTHLAPDRFVLGLGSSSHTMVESWYGTPFVKPLTRVRETVSLVRQILDGAKTDFEGETIRSKNFRLGLRPELGSSGRLPIYLAGLRPRMLELAGEIADGVILNLVPLEVLPRMLEHIDTGAKRSGRRIEDLEVAVFLYVFVTDDERPALEEMANIAAGYFSTPVYSSFLDWMGYPREAEQILEGFKQRNRSMTLGAFTDEVLHKLGVIGSIEHCRGVVEAYVTAGSDVPVIAGASSDPGVFDATLNAFVSK